MCGKPILRILVHCQALKTLVSLCKCIINRAYCFKPSFRPARLHERPQPPVPASTCLSMSTCANVSVSEVKKPVARMLYAPLHGQRVVSPGVIGGMSLRVYRTSETSARYTVGFHCHRYYQWSLLSYSLIAHCNFYQKCSSTTRSPAAPPDRCSSIPRFAEELHQRSSISDRVEPLIRCVLLMQGVCCSPAKSNQLKACLPQRCGPSVCSHKCASDWLHTALGMPHK